MECMEGLSKVGEVGDGYNGSYDDDSDSDGDSGEW